MESMKCGILKRRNEMAFFNTKRFTLWPIEVVMIIVFSVTGVVAYAAESVPNTFTAGTTISANQINQNFTSLATAMPAIKSVVVIDTFVAMPATTSSGGTTDVVTLSVNAPADGNMYLTATVYASLVGSPCTRGDLSTLGPDFQILESSDGNSVNTSIRGPSEATGTYTFHTAYPAIAGAHEYTLSASYASCVGDGLMVNNARLTGIFIPNSM
jgi:hypothetical protein